MSGFTTAFPNTLLAELAQAIHNFSAGGDQYKVALGKAAPVGTYDYATMNYSQLVANGDELPTGGGYTTGGFAFTAAQNVTPQLGVDPGNPPHQLAYWQWGANPQWLTLTASTSGCLVYNASKANRAVYVGSFGGVQVIAGVTLTLILPVNAPGSALLSLK